jgi:DNA-directed RNA polymerase specialized sigma24 family protein
LNEKPVRPVMVKADLTVALERYVLTLVYFYAQSQQQIAADLAAPASLVARAVARGLHAIAADLEIAAGRPGPRLVAPLDAA